MAERKSNDAQTKPRKQDGPFGLRYVDVNLENEKVTVIDRPIDDNIRRP